MTDNPDIAVEVETAYLAAQSIEAEDNYVFSYTITITNNTEHSIKLLSRYWLITDANNETTTVIGEGVIGKQPKILPNTCFTYTSGCMLKTPVGSMQGHYEMLNIDNNIQKVDIPVFGLSKPNMLN